ncbi:MAG: hypothetical protein ACYSWZ_02360 [Planctomycetota bacterium]
MLSAVTRLKLSGSAILTSRISSVSVELSGTEPTGESWFSIVGVNVKLRSKRVSSVPI